MTFLSCCMVYILIRNVTGLITHGTFPLFCSLRICLSIPILFFFSISAFPDCKLIFVSSTAHQFTNRDIALMLGVSQSTVERRISQLQMSNMSRYSNIDDDMLDSFVQRIITNFPRSGKWALRFPFVFIVSLSFRNPQNSTSRRTLNSSFAVLLRHENNRGLSSITRYTRSKVKVEEFLKKN